MATNTQKSKQVSPIASFVDSAISRFVREHWLPKSGIRSVRYLGENICVVVATKADAHELPLFVTGRSGESKRQIAVIPFVGTGEPGAAEKLVVRYPIRVVKTKKSQ